MRISNPDFDFEQNYTDFPLDAEAQRIYREPATPSRIPLPPMSELPPQTPPYAKTIEDKPGPRHLAEKQPMTHRLKGFLKNTGIVKGKF